MVRYLEYQGKSMRLADWAKHYQLSRKTLCRRLGMGWPIEKALNHPVRIINNPSLVNAKINSDKTYEAIVPCFRCGGLVRRVIDSDCIKCRKL